MPREILPAMTAEAPNDPLIIDPYLNPAYWDGRHFGDGDSTPWPEMKSKFLEQALALRFLRAYVNRGAPTLALARVAQGEIFDASDYPPGTVLLTLPESIRQTSADATPMSQFADTALPSQRAGIVDGSRELAGHGYTYLAEPLVNVTAGLGSTSNVYLLPYEKLIRPGITDTEIMSHTRPGVKRFIVGEAYHFAEKDNSTLIRVNELIVCMRGMGSKGKRVRAKESTAMPQLATEGGYA